MLVNENNSNNTIIIGAGPAGLAVAARLKKANITFIMLEQSNNVGNSWHNHYDRLHLHTVQKYSTLPFVDFPKDYPFYVPRQKLVEYMENYAKQFNIQAKFNQEVISVKKENGKWITKTQTGEIFSSYNVVVATGINRKPFFPSWEGIENFKGKIVHSKYYKNGKDYKGKKVLVIGMGNTGAELAIDLYEHGAIPFISVRENVNLIPRDFIGLPCQTSAFMLSKFPNWMGDFIGLRVRNISFGDLSPYGLKLRQKAPLAQVREEGKVPVIDIGTVDLIKKGQVKVLPGIKKFSQDSILFFNNEEIKLDAVLVCTGYKSNITDFIEDAESIIDADGNPKEICSSNKHKGLYFLGFDPRVNGVLWSIKKDSEIIVDEILKKQ